MSLCLFKLPKSEKAFGQKLHWKGFSLVWLRLCIVNSEDVLKAFLQVEHGNGFSQVRKGFWTEAALIWFFFSVAAFMYS